jgi:hypothetical protein
MRAMEAENIPSTSDSWETIIEFNLLQIYVLIQ